jgi:hypothetical protein
MSSQKKASVVSIASGRDIGTGKVVKVTTTQPDQLTLFQTFFPDDADNYSNTIDLYDAVPKYFASPQRMAQHRKAGVFLNSLQRRFKHNGDWYDLIVKPARIIDNEGNEKEYYPTSREEIVEEALKKIACDRANGVFLNDTAGVQFTLYELDKELKNQGHAIRWPDLITALKICRGAGIEITGAKGKSVVDSPIFPFLLLRNREEWRENPRQVFCYVQFNPLVTYSIHKMTYRQFDYVTFMKLTKPLSRYLFKRLSHNYKQASITDPFHILHSTLVRDSALINTKRIQDQMRNVREALDELAGKPPKRGKRKGQDGSVRVLTYYERTETKGARNKIEDVNYVLFPHPEFIAEMKRANRRQNEIKYGAEQTIQDVLIDDAVLRAAKPVGNIL